MASDTENNDIQRINTQGIKGEITIRLRWKKANFWQRVFGAGNIDLDLGCYCQMQDGRQTLLDCLQFGSNENTERNHPSKQGCFTMPPYAWHSGNHHGNARISEETVLVNPRGLPLTKRLMPYVFIYEGEPLWHKAKISIEVIVPGRGVFELTLDQVHTEKRFCAVADIWFEGEHTLAIKPLLTFHDGHSDCDNTYNWGFKYHNPKGL